MSRAIDALIAYRLIKLLVTRFSNTQAFKMGIIDDKGKVLIKSKDLPNSGPKREAYTLLIRFVFNLKRLLSKVGIRGPLTTWRCDTSNGDETRNCRTTICIT